MGEPWPLVPLGEVLIKSSETTPIHPDRTYSEVTVRMWGNGVVLRRVATGAEIAADRRAVVHAGEFILSRIDARNGAFGIVPASLNGAVVSNDFPSFRPVEDRLAMTYLGWLSKTASFVDLCRRASEGTTNRVRLKEELFLRMPIPLPVLEEQQRIVARIEAIAAQVGEAQRLRLEAAAEANALLAARERRAFPFEDAASLVPIEKACEALIDYRGRTPPITDAGIPHLTSANIKDGRISWQTTKYVTQATYNAFMTRGIPKVGDVIFTMEAPLGEAAVICDDRRFSLAQRTLLLRGRPDLIEGPYLAAVLRSPEMRDRMLGVATGTTVKGIAAKRLKPLLIPVPGVEEQRRIVAELDRLRAAGDELRKSQEQSTAELDALIPSVLDRAFKGEL